MSVIPYSLCDLRERIQKQPNLSTGFTGDAFLQNEDSLPFMRGRDSRLSWKKAAVLLLFGGRSQQAALIMTLRSAKLRDHSGQISFPGGKIEANDCSVQEAALREANEEIGANPQNIEVLGQLPCYYTGTGFEVYPIIGAVRTFNEYHPNRDEVAEIFEVPLSFLMQPDHHQCETRAIDGKLWRFYTISYGSYKIWGATAGMIRIFYERLYQWNP